MSSNVVLSHFSIVVDKCLMLSQMCNQSLNGQYDTPGNGTGVDIYIFDTGQWIALTNAEY